MLRHLREASLVVLLLPGAGCNKRSDSPNAPSSTAADVPGVQTGAGVVVASYLSAEACPDRLKSVADPARNEKLMREYWTKNNIRSCNKHPVSIEESGCDALAPGKNCGVLAKYETEPGHWYWVVPTDAGPKIDWRASMPYNPIALITFKATKPSAPSIFRLEGKISDYYNYEFRGLQKQLLSIDLDDSESRDHIHGYVARDSEDGKRALAALSDGKRRSIMVRLFYMPNSGDSSVARAEFLQDGWTQSEAEFAAPVATP